MTGLSNVTVVDVDERGLVDVMIRRCGATPLVTATPRGGAHLWYRSNGERSGDYLRQAEGLDVDIKAAGSLIVVPPSIALEGHGKGRAYRFSAGSWNDLPGLPVARTGSLQHTTPSNVHSLRGIVRHGLRNDSLLRLLLRQVRHCDTETDLLDVATTIVQQHFELENVPEFSAVEIAKTVRSAWTMETKGRNWTGKEAKIMTNATQFQVLQRNPDALTLWMLLNWMHRGHPDPFAISPKAMAEGEALDGWTYPRRYREARDWLIAEDFLERVHKGGARPGDPSLYLLLQRAIDSMEDKPSPIPTSSASCRTHNQGGAVFTYIGALSVPHESLSIVANPCLRR